MQAWKLLLSRMLIALVSIMVMDIGSAYAEQQVQNDSPNPQANLKTKLQAKSKTKSKAKPKSKSKPKAKSKAQSKPQPQPQPQPQLKPKKKPQASPVVGELDDTDTMPIEDEELDPDEEYTAPPKPKNNKGTSSIDQENTKNKKRDKTKEQILEGFKQAQQFHMTWHNLPPKKVEKSHCNLIEFCKVACTKKQCIDREVADKCHLMCPDSTTKQCPDPLKECGHDADREEVPLGVDEASGDLPYPTDDPDSSKVISPIDQAEKNIADGEGEEG